MRYSRRCYIIRDGIVDGEGMDGVRVGRGGCGMFEMAMGEYKMRQASEEDILFGVYLSSEKEASLVLDSSFGSGQ